LLTILKGGNLSTITSHVKHLVFEWGIHPYDINFKICENFANKIERRVKGARAKWDDEGDHCYIIYDNRYYDAEEPYGVDDPAHLPYYLRQRLQNITIDERVK
jgi:hypothetical protein